MIMYGKIISFNNYTGTILDTDGNTYILNKHNIRYNNPKIGDIVSFTIKEYTTPESHILIAIDVTNIKDK